MEQVCSGLNQVCEEWQELKRGTSRREHRLATIVYHQHAKEAAFTSELLGLSSTEGELIKTLHQGEALWRVGNRSFLVYSESFRRPKRAVRQDGRAVQSCVARAHAWASRTASWPSESMRPGRRSSRSSWAV